MSYRPDLYEPDVRPHVQELKERKHTRLAPMPLRRKKGRARDNLALHAPTHPTGGVPVSDPIRRLPDIRRRTLLPAFTANHAKIAEEETWGAEG